MSEAVDKQDSREPLIDPWRRKARIAARLILKKETGQPWSARDQRLDSAMATDPGAPTV